MARRRKRTHTDELAARERQAEIAAEADRAAAELRWNVFVDTMVALAAELASKRAAAPRTPSGPIDDTGQA